LAGEGRGPRETKRERRATGVRYEERLYKSVESIFGHDGSATKDEGAGTTMPNVSKTSTQP
jgi:hypothetical protein